MAESNAHIAYSFADIERYLSGGMTAKEMHKLEKAALQDPFLADAIEGYQTADKKLADKHLNEITAALQKEEPAKVIPMRKKKSYSWLAVASVLAIIGAGIFLFTGQKQSQKQLAANDIKEESQQPLPAKDHEMKPFQTDSQPSASSGDLALLKPKKKEADKRIAMLQKQMLSADKTLTDKPEKESAESSITMYAPAPAAATDDMKREQNPSLPSQDSLNASMSLSEVVVTKALSRQNKLANNWTTDKGKPFLMSDVEVINLDSKKRKRADTSAIQPEGGWQSFQNYLFSRLTRKDSLLLVTNNSIPDDIELEFSIDKSGLPYDIKVSSTQDSTVAGKIANAIQSGPKWKSSGSREKRLRIRY